MSGHGPQPARTPQAERKMLAPVPLRPRSKSAGTAQLQQPLHRAAPGTPPSSRASPMHEDISIDVAQGGSARQSVVDEPTYMSIMPNAPPPKPGPKPTVQPRSPPKSSSSSSSPSRPVPLPPPSRRSSGAIKPPVPPRTGANQVASSPASSSSNSATPPRPTPRIRSQEALEGALPPTPSRHAQLQREGEYIGIAGDDTAATPPAPRPKPVPKKRASASALQESTSPQLPPKPLHLSSPIPARHTTAHASPSSSSPSSSSPSSSSSSAQRSSRMGPSLSSTAPPKLPPRASPASSPSPSPTPGATASSDYISHMQARALVQKPSPIAPEAMYDPKTLDGAALPNPPPRKKAWWEDVAERFLFADAIWFHGVLDRALAEERVRHRAAGAFLVRASTSAKGFSVTLSSGPDGAIQHMLVQWLPDKDVFVFNHTEFGRLHDVLTRLKAPGPNGKPYITNPVMRLFDEDEFGGSFPPAMIAQAATPAPAPAPAPAPRTPIAAAVSTPTSRSASRGDAAAAPSPSTRQPVVRQPALAESSEDEGADEADASSGILDEESMPAPPPVPGFGRSPLSGRRRAVRRTVNSTKSGDPVSRVRGTTKGKSNPARPVSMPTQASGGSPTSTRKLAEGKGAASAGNIGAEEIYEPMEMEPAHKLKSGSKTALLPPHLEIAEEGEEGEVAGEGEGDGEGEEEAEMFEEDDDDFDEWSEVDEEEGDVDPGQSSISRTRSINSTSGGSKRGMYNELRMALTNRINSIDDLGRSGTLRRPGPATAGGLAADAPQAAVTGPVPAAAGAAGAADACRPAKLWSELPKVQASGLLRTLDKKAIKRQEAIYELVYSEEAFLADVQVLLEVYLLPMEAHARNAEFHGGKSLMKRDVVRRLLESAQGIEVASRDFVWALQGRRDYSIEVEYISDVLDQSLADLRKAFYAYNDVSVEAKPYVDHPSPEFEQFLQRSASDPRAKMLPLHFYLLVPLQRLSRYPLLIDAVKKVTPEDHPDYAGIGEVHEKYRAMLQTWNERMRANEERQALEDIAKLIDFRRIPSHWPIVGDEPRRLVKKGHMRLISANGQMRMRLKLVAIILFSDHLIYAKVKTDINRNRQYVAKKQVFRTLVTAEETEPRIKGQHLIRLTILEPHDKTELVLDCQSETDRSRWLEAFNSEEAQTEEGIYATWNCPKATALYNYIAQQPDELSLAVGDVVSIVQRGADWTKGFLTNVPDTDMLFGNDMSTSGWFPTSYVKEIVSKHREAKIIEANHTHNKSKSKPSPGPGDGGGRRLSLSSLLGVVGERTSRRFSAGSALDLNLPPVPPVPEAGTAELPSGGAGAGALYEEINDESNA